ncbi:MAG TPA: hypothetical protein VM674_02665 [Candidatus Acidoferrum sp.]|nr:hypothetical protein [Candidatus Acidoferrum sp.]
MKNEFLIAMVVIAVCIALIVLLALVGAGVGGVGVQHYGSGCSGVPLVNGQPAYQCPTPPPH